MTMQKYRNQIVKVGGETFQSRKELHRWEELCLMEKAGMIKNLRRQVKFILIPSQRETVWKKGKPKPGKVIERECSYIADFLYEENGETIVEDAKGYRTEAYKLKKKMMLHFHKIRIREV